MTHWIDQLTDREQERFWRYLDFRTRNRQKKLAKERQKYELHGQAETTDDRLAQEYPESS